MKRRAYVPSQVVAPIVENAALGKCPIRKGGVDKHFGFGLNHEYLTFPPNP